EVHLYLQRKSCQVMLLEVQSWSLQESAFFFVKNMQDVLDLMSEQVSMMKTASLLTSLNAKIKQAQRKENGSCSVIWMRFVQ
ncbi:Hypothetical predicted protein, partial [Paramuricea clavata]